MKNPRLSAVISILVFAALGACEGDRIVALGPSKITVASGNNQRGVPGSALPDPLAVSVTTSDGAGIAGVNVYWAVTTGAGMLTAANTITDADGRASVTWNLGSTLGTQSVVAGVVNLYPPALFSAIAGAPVMLHYDGTAWSTSLQDTGAVAISLSSIWGASPSQIFAAGKCRGNTLMLLYNGTDWSQPPASCPTGFLTEFSSVSGIAASDVFRVGRFPLPPSFNGWIDHYDGQAWNEVYRHACTYPCTGLRAIWSGAHNDAIAVGDAGEIRRYDGTSWTLQGSGTTNNLNAVWGIGPGSGVFAAGDDGTILYYNGSSWLVQTSGTTQSLYGIWGTSANDVFAVGGGGVILHYDGSAWTAQVGSSATLRGVWGSSGSSVFAVGDGSTILRYDGSLWRTQTVGASMNLRAVWGSSPTNVFAVGQPQ